MDPDFAARMLKPDGRGNVRGALAADEKSAQVGSAFDLGRLQFATGQCARASCNGDCLRSAPPPDLISFAKIARALSKGIRILMCAHVASDRLIGCTVSKKSESYLNRRRFPCKSVFVGGLRSSSCWW